MAKILSNEKSPFVQKSIEIYAKNKVGQFSKYLEKNPMFITYYSINQQMSRADTGIGSVVERIGTNSPIRYNEIRELPVYNFPELKPDAQNDETTGIDVELELTGLVIPPNTVKPTPEDHIYVKLPGMKYGVLLRVTEFEFNTLQSNDYYTINCCLDSTVPPDGSKCHYTQLQNQVVERYICIFDNIGTQDKCLVRDGDIERAKTMLTFINALKDSYYDTYYKGDVGTFCYHYYNGTRPTYLYDLYLIKFLKDSKLYSDITGERLIILNYDDILPMNFDNQFRKTLWYSVLTKNPNMLKPYSYYQTGGPIKTVSPFKMIDNDTQVTRLELYDAPINYRLSRSIGGITKEYFPEDLTKAIAGHDELLIDGCYDRLIYNYINGISESIDIQEIMETSMEPSVQNFFELPIVIYILQKNYDSIFESDTRSNEWIH